MKRGNGTDDSTSPIQEGGRSCSIEAQTKKKIHNIYRNQTRILILMSRLCKKEGEVILTFLKRPFFNTDIVLECITLYK